MKKAFRMKDKIYFCDVSEHDMDMLIMEEFICNEEFRKIFLEKLNIKSCKVDKAYHSLADTNGESDLTFIVKADGIKYGILIEDKIDAPTMDKQSERYYIRGDEGVKRGEYEKFYILLVCPKVYWEEHQEDKNAKYEYIVLYEELRDYLLSKDDLRSHYKLQIIEQALNAKKKGYQLVVNDDVTAFWKALQQFCEENFPSLYMSYDGKPKGSASTWIYFKTALKGVRVVYKTEPGLVDLEFDGYGNKISELDEIVSPYKDKSMDVYQIGKAAVVRTHKAKWAVSVKADFSSVTDEITDVLQHVMKLTELVKKIKIN